MFNKFSFWLKLAAYLQLITGVFHTLSLFADSVPANKEQQELFRMMQDVEIDFGAGFHLTVNDILFAFSVGFALFLFFTAIVNLVLLKSMDTRIISLIVWMNIIFYFLCFIVMFFYTFLPPIVCTFLILFASIMALITFLKKKGNLHGAIN